jgi:hypothetical protein
MRDKEQGEREHYRLRLAVQRKKQSYGPQPDGSISNVQRRMSELREQGQALDERIGRAKADLDRD